MKIEAFKAMARRRVPALMKILRKMRAQRLDRIFVLKPLVDTQTYPRRRILVDVSHTATAEFVTGIQRVVLRLTNEMILMNESATMEVVPVRLRRSQKSFVIARAVELEERLGLPMNAPEDISFRKGDILFFLDASWVEFPKYAKEAIPLLKSLGGRVVVCLYDLIPITHPHFCVPELHEALSQWLPVMIANADQILCISEATKADLLRFMSTQGKPIIAKLDYFHLGADFQVSAKDQAMVKGGDQPVVLMVGTIAPHKGYGDALAAFEILWEKGVSVRLEIIGKNGWFMDDFIDALKRHREYGKRLMVHLFADDNDLKSAYSRASVILSASHVEGFGLPIIEGAAMGKSVIASDIPTSREICGSNAIYFHVGDSLDLAKKIQTWLASGVLPPPPHFLSWKQSAEQALQRIGAAVS